MPQRESQILAFFLGVTRSAKDIVEAREQLVLSKHHGVSVGETGKQSALVLLIIHQDLFGVSPGDRELATHHGVLHGDGHRQLGCHCRCSHQRHTTLNEGSEDGEESTTSALDRRRVHTVFVDRAVAIEQVLPGNAHVGEVESTIVDSVQSTLGSIVIPADTREETVVVSERDVERGHRGFRRPR